MAVKINRENIMEHLIEYQLNLKELTILDALFINSWRQRWTLTPEQHEVWRKYCIKTIKKVFKCNTNKAKETFDWLNNSYGLKVK